MNFFEDKASNTMHYATRISTSDIKLYVSDGVQWYFMDLTGYTVV